MKLGSEKNDQIIIGKKFEIPLNPEIPINPQIPGSLKLEELTDFEIPDVIQNIDDLRRVVHSRCILSVNDFFGNLERNIMETVRDEDVDPGVIQNFESNLKQLLEEAKNILLTAGNFSLAPAQNGSIKISINLGSDEEFNKFLEFLNPFVSVLSKIRESKDATIQRISELEIELRKIRGDMDLINLIPVPQRTKEQLIELERLNTMNLKKEGQSTNAQDKNARIARAVNDFLNNNFSGNEDLEDGVDYLIETLKEFGFLNKQDEKKLRQTANLEEMLSFTLGYIREMEQRKSDFENNPKSIFANKWILLVLLLASISAGVGIYRLNKDEDEKKSSSLNNSGNSSGIPNLITRDELQDILSKAKYESDSNLSFDPDGALNISFKRKPSKFPGMRFELLRKFPIASFELSPEMKKYLVYIKDKNNIDSLRNTLEGYALEYFGYEFSQLDRNFNVGDELIAGKYTQVSFGILTFPNDIFAKAKVLESKTEDKAGKLSKVIKVLISFVDFPEWDFEVVFSSQ